MDTKKMNQKLLNRVVYLLDSYDYECIRVTCNNGIVALYLHPDIEYISSFVVDEIKKMCGDYVAIVNHQHSFGILFELDDNSPSLQLPDFSPFA